MFSLSVTADDATHHSLTSLASAAIAQLGERQTEDLKVPGLIPGLGMPAGAYAVWSPSEGDKGMGGFGGGASVRWVAPFILCACASTPFQEGQRQ